MLFSSFSGSPKEIGLQYGRQFNSQIHKNLDILIRRKGLEPLPFEDSGFIDWVSIQEYLFACNWPWLLEEMEGVAKGADVSYKEILLLNLRAWQYEYYGSSHECCSSLVITLWDGTSACCGALDDPIDYYCGPVRIFPTNGYGFISFPITGTSWANRGMNIAGLAIGISSQLLPGLKRADNAINQDLALRIILETCATVKDVRAFCEAHPFTMNLVCVDAGGDILCAHQTSAGLLELHVDNRYCALTNHVADDQYVYWLQKHGVVEFLESPTSRSRRGKLLEFARKHNNKCSAEEVRAFIGSRNDDDHGSINNSGTIFMSYSNPQNDSKTFWIAESSSNGECADFIPYSISVE